MKRDTQLDIYRAISMIYVICITHVLHWLNIGSEPIRSLILIEMPIIFFISGAALSLKDSPYGLLETVWNRFKRVVIPYYIYALVMIGIIAFLTMIYNIFLPQIEYIFGSNFSYNVKFDIFSYSWSDYVAIISCTNIPQSPFSWHLWFIQPYIILSCTFGFQIKLIKGTNRWVYALITVVLFIFVQSITCNTLLQNVTFYNIFMVIGYLFYRHINMWQVFITGIITLMILVIYTSLGGWFLPMQNHKFPPDHVFLLYNLLVLCVLSIILNRISIPNLKIFQTWNTRGYTLYLYQNVLFFFVYPFYKVLISNNHYQIIQWGICAVIMFVLSTIISHFTFSFERQIIHKLKIYK